MVKIILEEQPEFAVLPSDSILELLVEEANVVQVEGRNGPWQKVECKFKILGIQAVGDGSPKENYASLVDGPIWGSVPFKLTDSPENKLRQWAEAILQVELGLGFELDTDMFERRQCRGVTSQYDAKAKDPSTGLPFKRHQVEFLLPKTSGLTPQPVGQSVGAAAATAPLDPWGATQQGDEPPF